MADDPAEGGEENLDQEEVGAESTELAESYQYFTDLKHQVWAAIGDGDTMPPDFGNLLDRPFTLLELHYLMERFATFTIWDVYNLEPSLEKTLIAIEGQSPHYSVYDKGSHLVCAPTDLFSHERTSADAMQTARAMAAEVFRRGWTVELSGFDKMMRIAWVELQVLGHKHNKPVEVLHYDPTDADRKLCDLREGKSPSMMKSK